MPLPKVALPDGKMASVKLAEWMPQLQRYALPCLRITATPNDDMFLFDSKLAGLPYWPTSKPYPVDSYGKYMYLLAQLNFSQMPPLEGYPDKGILQFYLADDDLYGMDFDNPTAQTNFRVVYFEDTTAAALDNFNFLQQQVRDGGWPVERPMRLQFTPDTDYYSFSDMRFPDELDDVMTEDKPAEHWQSMEEELEQLYPYDGHKIGGYAYFTQSDPREDNDAYKDYILLLQIDSQLPDICWGDLGVGNFFIHPDDLKRKDFSKVLYNWDCT